IVSGTIGEQTAVEVMRAGAHDYVMKDNLTRLGPAVERELREAQNRRERRRAQEALEASEERYRSLVETMGDGISMIAPDRTITYANEAFSEMVGYRADELIGMPLTQLYAPSSQAVLREQLDRRFSEGVSAEYEATLLSRSGREIPVLTHATAMRDAEGEITGALAVIKDITGRKRAEERLRESEERMRAVFDASPDGIVAVTADLRITDCNAVLAEMAGADSVEDVVGRSVTDFVSEDSRERLVRNFNRVLTEGSLRVEEYEAVTLDGARYPIEVSANLICDDDGEPESVVATVEDITERKEAQREIQELAEFRRSIIDQANIWIHVLDRDLNTIVWNPAAAEISGVPEAEALDSRDIWNAMYPDPDVRAEMLALATEIIEEGRILENYESTITTRDGDERTISWNASRLLGPESEPIGLLAMARDVTEHRQLEQQLRQAVKMEAIGRLAGGIAHDFNNMLTAILGNTQLIEMRMDKDDDSQRLLREIQIAARRSADLTRQLLAFSRKQALEAEALDLNTLIERLEPMLERMLGEQIAILTRTDPELGLISADPSQIDQVLMNLVINARDAMPDGGTLTIETANARVSEEEARGRADIDPGPYVTLSVSDTGVGMDAETRERVFEPFFTTKGAEQGTGLGLATVYGIVNQSGGHIHVYSEPGEGTVFRVYLPRVESGEAADLDDEERSREDLRGGETVLVVEDDEIVRKLVTSVLTRHGHTVLSAESAEEALEVAAAHRDGIEIMVTDVIMPGMNGPELAEEMAAHHPDMPVLFVSGYAEEAIMHEGVLDEGIHFMQKPFGPEKLLRRIRSVLDGKD
ncbi:MAG: PAS domain-containing hybrid sensor histidine kinase/response regulator, partial [Armatimonadota bacterium]